MNLRNCSRYVVIAFAVTVVTGLGVRDAVAKPYACGNKTCSTHPTKFDLPGVQVGAVRPQQKGTGSARPRHGDDDHVYGAGKGRDAARHAAQQGPDDESAGGATGGTMT